MVVQVQDQTEFKAKLEEAGAKLVVVDFFATWCGPCKLIAPQIDAFAKEFGDVVFLKIDVDENEEVAAEYNINCMPTFILFKNKSKIDEFSGANADKLKELIAKHR